MFKKFSEWLSDLCDNIAETVKRAFGRRGTKVCSVCRRRVKLEASKTYIAKEPKAPLALGTADVFFTATDCPYCGSQIMLSIYCPPYEPEEGCDDED